MHQFTAGKTFWIRLLALVIAIAGLTVSQVVEHMVSSSSLKDVMYLVGFVFLVFALRTAVSVLACLSARRDRFHAPRDLDPDSPKIVIVRAGGFWRDRLRRYRVFIDGKSVGWLSEYGTLVTPVEPGTRYVQVKIDLFKSSRVTVRIGLGETKHLVCSAGTTDEMPPTKGYPRLWQGQVTTVVAPVPKRPF